MINRKKTTSNMKLLKTGSFFLVAALSLTNVKAQTADEIVNKHLDALGGKEKIKAVKSIYMEGTVNVMGNEAPLTITLLDGKGYKSEVDFNGQKIVQAYNDKGGWMINPMMGASDPQPLPEEQYKMAKEQMYAGGAFLDYAVKGNKVELVGRENVNNVNAYKLKLTTSDGAETTYYIDPSTYYITKVVKEGDMGGQKVELAVNFSDYKKTDFGFAIPHTYETVLPQGFSMTSSIKKVEINKDIDPKVFEMPAK